MPLGGDHQVASLDRLLPIPEDRSQAREHWEAILGSGPHAIIKSLESLLRVGNGECTRFWRGFDGCSPSSPGNLSLSLGRHDKAGVILVLRPTFARASMSLPGEPSGWVVREWVLGTRSIDSASEVLAPCNDQFPSDLTAVVKLLTEAITRFQKHRPLHVDSMNEEVIDF